MPPLAKRAVSVFALVFFGSLWFARSCPAQTALRAEALVGEPFGVGRVELDLPPSLRPELLGLGGLDIREKEGRVLYPAVQRRPVAEALRIGSQQASRIRGRLGPVLNRAAGIVGAVAEAIEQYPRVTVYFLFRGTAPLDLTIHAQRLESFRLTPVSDPNAYHHVLGLWWRAYTMPSGLLRFAEDYPPIVDNYLQSMLARRLQLPLPRAVVRHSWQALLEQNLELGTGVEAVRVAMERARFLGETSLSETASQPLPEAPSPPELEVPDTPADVPIEPLARRVPAECFYVRFGSFSNFLWLQDLLAQWGGDLQNLVAQRGLDYGLRERIERQLVLKTSTLARLLGDTVIADVAMVGTDFFLLDGGSFGFLFHARNSTLLQADLNRQRLERLAQKDGANETRVTLAGREVRLLASPDGHTRSFYATDGDYHFITNSRTLAQRFLQTRSGQGSLAALKAFRYARQVMPLDRKDTIFVYLSDPFFRHFTSPQYRIETVRRLQALADLELVELARLAARAEGKAGETIEQLVSGGFLPPDFGPRPDGSRAVLEQGVVRDLVRGRRGCFVPAADVPVSAVTPSEAAQYRDFVNYYLAEWQRLDPVLVALKRTAQPGNREQIVLDVRMTPFARRHYEILRQWFDQPDSQQLAPIANDAIAMEALLPGRRVFGGIWQMGTPPEALLDRSVPLGQLRNLVIGYLGTTGEPGPLMSLLNLRILTAPDANGYAASEGGLWRRQIGPFTVFSYQPDVLAAVTEQLRLIEADQPAQLRARVMDLSNARITPFLNNLGYLRTRQTSLGNLRLLHRMMQQLHVAGPDSKAAAEAALDARLIDPLGGQYVYRQTPAGTAYWTSTALEGSGGEEPGAMRPPQGYQAPPLNWFRAMKLLAQFTPEALTVHAEVIMQTAGRTPAGSVQPR